MKTLIVCFDVSMLLALWWASLVFLHKSGHVQTWRDAVLTAGLVGTKVFAFVGALAVGTAATPLPLWARGLVTAAVVVAAHAYDHRFGILRHVGMAVTAVFKRKTT